MKKKNRIGSLLLGITITCGMFSFASCNFGGGASSSSIKATEGILYEIAEDGTYAMVSGYEGTDTDVVIAQSYQGVPVIYIQLEAFRNSGLTSVVIPDSITEIGPSAFSNCADLTHVELPDTLTDIDLHAFKNCQKLVDITFPDDLTVIMEEAFLDCDSLTSVEIPGNVNIGRRAFYSCDRLASVILSDGINLVANEAFSDCPSLHFQEYDNCRYLGNTNNPYYALIECADKSLSSYAIHQNTKVIAGAAFWECANLTAMILPDGIIGIGAAAFQDCQNLSDISLPNSVTSIGMRAFYNCQSLTSIVLPDGITSISGGLFADCQNLSNIYIPDSVTRIDPLAFENCKSFTLIIIPDSVTVIGSRAFYNCNLQSVVIGRGVTRIGARAFFHERSSGSIAVYYKGATATEWEQIDIGSGNNRVTAGRSYYIENAEDVSKFGSYWHYDENGNPVVW